MTVEKKEGPVKLKGETVTLVDLPGIYSVAATSEDERVSRDYLLSGEADLVVDVVDASNLERNLYLTTQLIEMGVPVLVVLTMMDLAAENKLEVDTEHLARHLGLPVVAVDATEAKAGDKIRAALEKALEAPEKSGLAVTYPDEIEKALAAILSGMGKTAEFMNVSERYAGLKVLEGDPTFCRQAGRLGTLTEDKLQAEVRKVRNVLKEEPDVCIADARYGLIHGIVVDVVRKTGSRTSLTERIDKIALNRAAGIPLFLLAMYLVFWTTMNVGGAFIDFFDILFGTLFVDGFSSLLEAAGAPAWLVAALAGGLGAGVQTVATFIPVIFTLFLALSVLEDSGYMARAAFVMDRFLRFLGLPGKAFVPSSSASAAPCRPSSEHGPWRTAGPGDDHLHESLHVLRSPAPGVRPLRGCLLSPVRRSRGLLALSRRDRLFPAHGAPLQGRGLQGRGLPLHHGASALPSAPAPAHPDPHLVQAQDFRASGEPGHHRHGADPRPPQFLRDREKRRQLRKSEHRGFAPLDHREGHHAVFEPLGIREDNWPATVGIFTGLFAKEAVVGTLNSLYGQESALKGTEDAPAAGEKNSISWEASRKPWPPSPRTSRASGQRSSILSASASSREARKRQRRRSRPT